MSIMKLLATDGFIAVNKTLIKEIGLEAAVVFGELCSEGVYWESQEKLTEDGMFYCSIQSLEETTGLSEYKQRNILKQLQKEGYIEIELRGMPATRYLKICEEQLLKIFGIRSEIFKGTDPKNFRLSNNITNNNTKKEKNNTKVLLENGNGKSQFLKQGGKVKKPSLYQNCLAMIQDYTEEEDIRQLLIEYLNLRLQVKDKPLYKNQFKGLLNKLSKLIEQGESCKEVIMQSIERCYLSFYPIKKFENNNTKEQAWNRDVKSLQLTEKEKQEEEQWRQEMIARGEKIVF